MNVFRKPHRLLLLIFILAATEIKGTDAFQLKIEAGPDGISISWVGSALLQSAPTVNGRWQTIPNASSPHTVSPNGAMFYRLQKGSVISVSRSGSGTGKVVSIPPGIDCGGDCSELFADGQEITLQATADPGCTFVGWGIDAPGPGRFIFTVNGSKNVTAMFVNFTFP